MKQGKGTDVLGANDPRSEAIGVIYVSPNDDRKSVLAAILTQEKLGRKQVAVVLPQNQNKAFQRPGDFDDLKTMRRKLQTQVVFIAPSGPGPAEFARQRRFLVYSSLESYAKALRDEMQVESATKKSWLFGSPRAKADGASTPSSGALTPSTQELNTPMNGRSSPFDEDEDEHDHNGSLLPFAAGAAIGGGAALAADSAFNGRSQGPTAAPPQDFADDADDLGPLPATPAPADLYGATQVIPPSHGASADTTTDGGGIIELRSRRNSKATLPLSPREPDPVPVTPVVTPEADATTNRPRRSTGKMAAAVGVGAAAGAVAAVAATPTRASAQGRASAAAGAGAVAPRPGNPGGIPPRSTPPGRGGGGNGRGPKSPLGWVFLVLVVLAIALLSCGGVMAFAQPKSLPGQVVRSLASQQQSPASVTITPSSQTIQDTYTLVGANKTNPTSRQVAVQTITGAAQSAATPVKATGHSQHNARAATGQLTFSNSLPTQRQVPAGLAIPAGNGVNIVLDQTAVMPPAPNSGSNGVVTVPAHAEPAGRVGNVGALTFDLTACCGNNVTVTNNAAFAGGQDAVNYTFLLQSDVNNAISQSIKDVTKQDALNDLKRQLGTGEQLLNATNCTPTVRADQPIGDQGTNINSANVSYLMKCTSTAYDSQGAQNIVKDLLTQKATTTLAPGYILMNNIQTSLTNQAVTRNALSLFFSGKGIWAYQFTDAQKLQLAKSIAGKTVAQAQAILKSTTGVGNATINVNGSNTLPTDYNQISIVIQPIAGLGGGGTPSPNGSPTVTNPTVQSGTPGANGKGGSVGGS